MEKGSFRYLPVTFFRVQPSDTGSPMNRLFSSLVICLGFMVVPGFAGEHEFTDDEGRKVRAEVVGFQGENVVLRREGKLITWPVGNFSEEDQAFLREWKTTVAADLPVQVRIWEREGIGSKGVLNHGRISSGGEKNIPLLQEVEEKGSYRHYDIDLHNHAPVDATKLTVTYLLYVITPERKVVGEKGSETVDLIASGQRKSLKTGGITYVRTKTTRTTLQTVFYGFLQFDSETDRTKETFGGAWVKVFNADGDLVGEAKDLIPQLEKMNPSWDVEDTTSSSQTGLQKLQETLTEIRDSLEKLEQ